MSKSMQKWIAIFTLFGILFGAFLFLDKRYSLVSTVQALAETVKLVENRLDWKITVDQLNALQDREWKITDRYANRTMPDTVKEELRKIRKQIGELQLKLEHFNDPKTMSTM
jgi:hypothetical protein